MQAPHGALSFPHMTGRKRVLIAGAVLAAMLIPIPYQASPEWTVTVTDEAGRPLSGMQVSLSYENYATESTSHEINLITGDDGRVNFPANMGFAPLLSRCYFTARSASAVAHASFGSSAFVTVFGDNREGSVNSADGSVYSGRGIRAV